MGLLTNLFYDGDNDSETLFNRVSLTSEQEEHLKDKKDSVQEHLEQYLSKTTGKPISFYIQGSYKNKTLIKPVRKGEEYDVDIGVYIHWRDDDSSFTSNQLRDWTYEGLNDYVTTDAEATIEDKRKERCERVRFENEFHLDMPVYHFEPTLDERRLATLSLDWEASDPKLFQDWFRDNTPENQRHEIRRCIKYLKAWSSLKWQDNKKGKFPSIVITVLAAQLWTQQADDEDNLIYIIENLNEYFLNNTTVPNPIYPEQDLLSFNQQDLSALQSKISDLYTNTQNIKDNTNIQSVHFNWTYVFDHLLPPLPDEIVEESRKNLPAIAYTPSIEAIVTDKKSGRHVGTYNTDFSTHKNCDIRFRISNAAKMPAGSEMVWMVRNQGKEASSISDLGHKEILQPSQTTKRGTAYIGPHYMECYVTRNGNVIGYDRIGVKVRSIKMPDRNPKKPSYTRARK